MTFCDLRRRLVSVLLAILWRSSWLNLFESIHLDPYSSSCAPRLCHWFAIQFEHRFHSVSFDDRSVIVEQIWKSLLSTVRYRSQLLQRRSFVRRSVHSLFEKCLDDRTSTSSSDCLQQESADEQFSSSTNSSRRSRHSIAQLRARRSHLSHSHHQQLSHTCRSHSLLTGECRRSHRDRIVSMVLGQIDSSVQLDSRIHADGGRELDQHVWLWASPISWPFSYVNGTVGSRGTFAVSSWRTSGKNRSKVFTFARGQIDDISGELSWSVSGQSQTNPPSSVWDLQIFARFDHGKDRFCSIKRGGDWIISIFVGEQFPLDSTRQDFSEFYVYTGQSYLWSHDRTFLDSVGQLFSIWSKGQMRSWTVLLSRLIKIHWEQRFLLYIQSKKISITGARELFSLSFCTCVKWAQNRRNHVRTKFQSWSILLKNSIGRSENLWFQYIIKI